MKIREMCMSYRIRFADRFAEKEIFPSFDEALRKCGKAGYDDEELAKTVYEKTVRDNMEGRGLCARLSKYHRDVYSILLALVNDFGEREVRVLDFGGACGEYYFAIRSKADPRRKLNWCVLETEPMCGYGKRLENDELKFLNDIGQLKLYMPEIDLVNVSGAIQYTNKPFEFLNSILEVNAKYIIFSRMCFTPGDQDIVFIQKNMLSWHGLGELPEGSKDREMSHPFTAMSKNRFDAMVQQKYEYQNIFKDNSGVARAKNIATFGLGLLCKRKN